MTGTQTTPQPRDLAAHMREAHGWTIWETEETDLGTLRAMHRVAVDNNGPCDHSA